MRAYRTALLCLLPLLATPAVAETRYDVEIIVVQQQSSRDTMEERWRPTIAVPEFERAGTFSGDTGDPLPDDFERLPAADARLGSTLERLESSSDYRVLRHLRWRQPALAPGESIPIRLRSGEPVAIEAPLSVIEHPVPAADNESVDERLKEGEGAVTGETSMEDNTLEATETETSEGITLPGDDDGDMMPMRSPHGPASRRVSVHPLDGTIELVVSRYLHIHADLYLTRPVQWDQTVMSRGGRGRDTDEPGTTAAPEDGAEPAGTSAAADALAPRIARGPDDAAMLSFPFRQSRRMRSGELHYLDHPLIGLLVLVTPYESGDTPGDGADDGDG